LSYFTFKLLSNRIKPDILAPGASIMSARSNGNGGQTCDVVVKQGTSQAAPGAAGSAALIMDYFTNSNFWSSTCNSAYTLCQSFTPSGVLMKAIVLHSGSSMTLYNWGTAQGNVALGAPPDMYQGYGRINLKNVLPLTGVSNFDLFVADLVLVGENANIDYSVQVTGSGKPLRATIAWYDPPNSGKPARALLNNLDLKFVSPSGKRLIPKSSNDSVLTITKKNKILHFCISYYGNKGTASKKDCVNNNERISISNPETGAWLVSISTAALPYSGSQAFSLVITSIGSVTPQNTYIYRPLPDPLPDPVIPPALSI